MLGSTLTKRLREDSDLDVISTTSAATEFTTQFDILRHNLAELIDLTAPEVIVNCAGKIKPEIDENSPLSVQNAIKINSDFPYDLRKSFDGQIIQIATDCVFSGKADQNSESSLHDPLDVYGKTKSLGEVKSEKFLNIRCSIIGRELGTTKSLIEWVLKHQKNATLNGYTDHVWNGVTTHAFADVVAGLIQENFVSISEGTVHLLPSNKVSKFELVSLISHYFGRDDLKVSAVESGTPVNRALSTNNSFVNDSLWIRTTYGSPPSIEEMISNYASWME